MKEINIVFILKKKEKYQKSKGKALRPLTKINKYMH